MQIPRLKMQLHHLVGIAIKHLTNSIKVFVFGTDRRRVFKTPPLSAFCIASVMVKLLVSKCRKALTFFGHVDNHIGERIGIAIALILFKTIDEGIKSQGKIMDSSERPVMAEIICRNESI